MSGHVRVYSWDGSSWQQLGQDIDGEAADDLSGWSVSMNDEGTVVAIGSIYNTGGGINSGHVRVYGYNGTTWGQLGQDIDGEAAGARNGHSVSMNADGTIVAIGATGAGAGAGYVRVFNLVGGSWVKLGDDIPGEATLDQSGWSVSMSADVNRVAIGAIYNTGGGINSGHVRVYEYNGSSWQKLGDDIPGEAAGDFSGKSVSMNDDGTIVAIGAYANAGGGIYSGHVSVYGYNGTTWEQLGQDIDGEAAGDVAGWSVSISNDGNIVAIGSPQSGNNVGHAHVYIRDSNVIMGWSQLGLNINGDEDNEYSGEVVSISADGTKVAIGAAGSLASDPGHVRVYEWV
jgi:hypothetical protein